MYVVYVCVDDACMYVCVCAPSFCCVIILVYITGVYYVWVMYVCMYVCMIYCAYVGVLCVGDVCM